MIEVETGGQGQGRIELPVGHLGECVFLEALRSLAFALDDELIVLRGYAHVLLRHAGKNRPQVQEILIPAGFHNRAERPGSLSARIGSGGLPLAIEVFKHLIDRPAELIQRLPNVSSKQCVQHKAPQLLVGFRREGGNNA